MSDLADVELIHYASEPVALDRSRTYAPDSFKPDGLWVSVRGEDDWAEWCRGEGFRLRSLAHEYRVTMTPEARILHLSTLDAVRALRHKYPHAGSYLASVDWPALARDYDGIIIAPYQWGARLDAGTHWYYPWDCASGCIWNLAAVESFALASEVVAS